MKIQNQAEYVIERRIWLEKLKEQTRVENAERLKNQQEKNLLEQVRDKQRIDNDKGRYIDIKV